MPQLLPFQKNPKPDLNKQLDDLKELLVTENIEGFIVLTQTEQSISNVKMWAQGLSDLQMVGLLEIAKTMILLER